MKGDFSRDSFDALRHYSRVLQQQGRVALDADGNERESIQLHHLRSLAADVIGPFGGPGTGFQLLDKVGTTVLQQNFLIGKGHYYVDGWLCENDGDVFYASHDNGPSQPWLPAPLELENGKNYLAYLDVWERHVTAAEVDGGLDTASPGGMREVALGGPDTTTRAQVVWQVKVSPDDRALLPATPLTAAQWATWMDANWATWRSMWQPVMRGRLKARATTTDPDTGNPCVASPQSRYRGLENQLYRIEVHQGGTVGSATPPTFVWSRENGSVVSAVEHVGDRSLQLVAGWRDARFALSVGDVLELLDEDMVLKGAPGPLVRVTGVDLDDLTISFEAGSVAPAMIGARATVLRRWDHGHRDTTRTAANDGRPVIAKDLALTLTEGRWLTIEDGISIFFDAAALPDRQQYRTGDYWLIPARTAIGDILWPRTADVQRQPLSQPPHGVEHHYAPLAIVTVNATGGVTVVAEPTKRFKSLMELSQP